MNDRSTTRSKDPSAIRELLHSGQLAWRLIGDRRVSWSLKLIPILALVYFVSPLDLLPDFLIPGLLGIGLMQGGLWPGLPGRPGDHRHRPALLHPPGPAGPGARAFRPGGHGR